MSTVKRIPKPWGHEVWYARAKRYVGKIIVINKGQRLSRQFHKTKHETVYVLKGRLRLQLGRKTSVRRPGFAATIPPKTIHRFSAPYGPVTLLEVSTPEVFDVVRLEDDYGRK